MVMTHAVKKLLALCMILVFVATIAQVNIGSHQAQTQYFRSWMTLVPLAAGDFRMPLPLPGGLTLGTLLIVNLLVAQFNRFKLRPRTIGILLIHTGILLLLVGELLTAFLGSESQMVINENQTVNYSTAPREVELVVIDKGNPDRDHVKAIPQSRLRDGAEFSFDGFTVRIKRFLQNSEIVPTAEAGPEFEDLRADKGPGVAFAVREMPLETASDRRDLSSAFVEIIQGDDPPLGCWLVSNALTGQQEIRIGDTSRVIAMRQRRFYHPFSITLLDFSHDRYQGTEIPKNFSSRVRIEHAAEGESRETLIYMNHPLRYNGLTFYQSGFDNDDTTTILQVVKNPVWTLPYTACAMVSLGLLWVFSLHLLKALTRRRTGLQK
jgi:hypothetical protein